MFLTEKEEEVVKKLNDLKNQVDLLNSHKVVRLISEKQYAKSLKRIYDQIVTLEEEVGYKPENVDALDLLYGEGASNFDESMIEAEMMAYVENGQEEKEVKIFEC